MSIAPETKSADPAADASRAFDEFARAFEAFKDTNDSRLSRIETRLSGDVVTEEKLARIGDVTVHTEVYGIADAVKAYEKLHAGTVRGRARHARRVRERSLVRERGRRASRDPGLRHRSGQRRLGRDGLRRGRRR